MSLNGQCINAYTEQLLLLLLLQSFYGPLSGTTWVSRYRINLLVGYMVQGKITETDALSIWLGATPSRLISDPPLSSPIFMLDALPAAILLIYPGLGQASNMLACIPSDLVILNI